MRRLLSLALLAVLALLTAHLPASAQQRPPSPAQPAAQPQPRSSAVPAAAPAAGPAFQSGGLKATVTGIAAQGSSFSLTLLIENKSPENLMVAVIGPPLATHAGNVYDPVAVGGIASCIYNPQNLIRHTLERSFEINGCLRAEKPQLTLDAFTLIDAGSTVPMNVGFGSPWKIDPTKDLSFTMNLAIYKESEANADDNPLAAKSKEPRMPKSLRYISVGIPSVPIK
jgi:hypothetical protein